MHGYDQPYIEVVSKLSTSNGLSDALINKNASLYGKNIISFFYIMTIFWIKITWC